MKILKRYLVCIKTVVDTSLKKYKHEGGISLIESVWRNTLRRTLLGRALKSVLGNVFVEKLVMLPRVGYWPRIKEPRSFNEKIAHRKIYTCDPRMAYLTNKVSVRNYVRERVSEKILNEIYYITEDPNKIPFGQLPDSFVVKTGNKGVIIVNNKSNLNKQKVINQCYSALENRYGEQKNEYWYDNSPKIVVEKKLTGQRQQIPIDYKLHCFSGRVEYIQVDVERFGDHRRSIYNRHWEYLDVSLEYPHGDPIRKPKNLDEMISISERLAQKFNFVRVDLYQTREKGIIFGEMTFAPGGGAERFYPVSEDFTWGHKWNIKLDT